MASLREKIILGGENLETNKSATMGWGMTVGNVGGWKSKDVTSSNIDEMDVGGWMEHWEATWWWPFERKAI